LFIGSIGSDRVYRVCDKQKKTKIPSDYSGVTYLMYDSSRSDKSLRNALSPACTEIKETVNKICDETKKSSGKSPTILNADISNRSLVVGISGGICSGKTWLAHLFKKICPKSVCLFELDGYY
jgi:hypothetical protein